MFKKLFCKHEYSLYQDRGEFISNGYVTSRCYVWTFICKNCGCEFKITDRWIEERLLQLREQHRKKQFLGKTLLEESTLILNKKNELRPKSYDKDEDTYAGSYVTEFIQELQKMGIDYKDFER